MEDAEKTIKDRKENIKNKLSNWIKDEHNKIFILILTLALAIRFYIFLKTLNQPIWWDAADYLATAKRWAGLNPHMADIWYYRRGFFWPLFSSFFFRFGLGEIGIRFMVFLFSTGIVLFSYLTIKKMFNKELALFTSLCLTFSWVILFFTGRPLTNLPASFFLIVALYFFWRGYILGEGNKFTYLFGIFFGITILTRTQYLMFAIPFFAIIFLKEKFKFLKNKNLWITVGIMFLVYLPQFIIHWGHFGNPILDLANYYLGIEGISEKAEVGVELAKFSDLFIYFGNLPYMLSKAIFSIFIIGLVYFFFDLVIGIDKIFKNKTLQTKLFILVWIVSTFIVLGYMAPHLEQRYVMQTLPFLFLIAVSPLPLIKEL